MVLTLCSNVIYSFFILKYSNFTKIFWYAYHYNLRIIVIALFHVGVLSAVRDIAIHYMNGTALITWKPPYHYLNFIPRVTHYCVNIFNRNTIFKYSSHLLSECYVHNTSYVFNYNVTELGRCYSLRYEITSVNFIGNGTIASIKQTNSGNNYCLLWIL